MSKADECQGQFISKVFTVSKPDGSYRLILNLKILNNFVKSNHFKIEDNKTVAKLLSKGCYMGKIDLKDAYHLVPVKQSHCKYLRFKFNGELYQYNCLPFGLSCAPLIFTKILRPVVKILRGKGILLVVYLDDFLIIGRSYEECQNNIKITIELLSQLGFLINYKKCSLLPTQKCIFLGFIYNSLAMTISLPEDKQKRIIRLLKRNFNLPRCKIRDFAKFIGTLVSACPGIKYGFLHTKIFEYYKYKALKESKGNYNAVMNLSKNILHDLSWFINIIPNSFNHVHINNYSLEIFTDASSMGWGVFCQGKSTYGQWSEQEKTLHINALEMLALYFGLKCYTSNLSNCYILCRVDNTTAVATINRMGSVRFIRLNIIARKIWSWCEKRNIFIFASYINTKENIEADKASRKIQKETEWSLSNDAYQKIIDIFGTPRIDLFASRLNKKCETFISWMRDPEAFKVDAFTVHWGTLRFYAFPPFSMILKTLQKIINDEAEGIVVVPFWISQPWYPLFKSLIVGEPLVFRPKKYLLSSSRTPHPLWQHLSLVAGRLSGKRFSKGMFPENP